MQSGSEFQIDPTVIPEAPLSPSQLFLEFSSTLKMSAPTAEVVDREFGRLLQHLPPSPWSPLTKASHRELQAIAVWPGGINLQQLDLHHQLPVTWRMQWLERNGDSRNVVLRCGVVLDMGSRTDASRAAAVLQELPGSAAARPMCPGTVELPGATLQALDARLERAADALDLISLDDDTGETRGLGRQRHMYGEIPVVIELWSSGDYFGRTWMLLAEDVVARFGSLDLEAVERLIQPDITSGLRASAHERDGAVLVNEQ